MYVVRRDYVGLRRREVANKSVSPLVLVTYLWTHDDWMIFVPRDDAWLLVAAYIHKITH